MLYNKKWDLPIKTVPSLIGLIAWLETQDPAQEYDWSKCDGTCLVSQYLTSIGILDGEQWKDYNYHKALGLPEAGSFNIAYQRPWTFGAALLRARAVLKEQGS